MTLATGGLAMAVGVLVLGFVVRGAVTAGDSAGTLEDVAKVLDSKTLSDGSLGETLPRPVGVVESADGVGTVASRSATVGVVVGVVADGTGFSDENDIADDAHDDEHETGADGHDHDSAVVVLGDRTGHDVNRHVDDCSPAGSLMSLKWFNISTYRLVLVELRCGFVVSVGGLRPLIRAVAV